MELESNFVQRIDGRYCSLAALSIIIQQNNRYKPATINIHRTKNDKVLLMNNSLFLD
jgi:hypothetical protein